MLLGKFDGVRAGPLNEGQMVSCDVVSERGKLAAANLIAV